MPVVEAAALTMDSTLADVAAQPEAWERVQAVLERHLPGIPIDGHAPEAASVTLRGLVAMIPGASDHLTTDLTEAVTDPEENR